MILQQYTRLFRAESQFGPIKFTRSAQVDNKCTAMIMQLGSVGEDDMAAGMGGATREPNPLSILGSWILRPVTDLRRNDVGLQEVRSASMNHQ